MVIIGFAFVVLLICELLWAGTKSYLSFGHLLSLCLVYHKLLENVG